MTPPRKPLDISQAARLFEAGNLAEAERLCRRLLKRNRNDVQAEQMLGSIAMARGTYEDAAQHYGRCVRLSPRIAGLHFLYGKACSMLGRYDEAIAVFDKALALKPGDHVVTAGGIYGTIVGIKDDRLTLRIADQVKIEITKSSVAGLDT